MFKKLFVILLVLHGALSYAQTLKTDVLVIGSSASGAAAAIQCARSKVKTILADEGSKLGGGTTVGGMLSIETNRNIQSGIWGEFRRHIIDFYRSTPGYDTTYNAPLKFDAGTASSILKKITDTVKNLTVYKNALFTEIKKDGDRWEVKLTADGKVLIIKARVIIDATEDAKVAAKAGAKLPASFNYVAETGNSNLYRTSITTGEAWPNQQTGDNSSAKNNYPPSPSFCIPVNDVFLKDEENILITEKLLGNDKNIQYLPLQLQLGQGAGTIAAFCAFFKTTTKHLDVRTIQGELLDFKGYLLPFTDIRQNDAAWRAIQQVGATGMLKGKQQANGQFEFLPDTTINTAEIKPVLTEIYTRAFLWFNKEKPGEKFTIGNTISFISDYTLTDLLVLKKNLSANWKTHYKFKLDFDLNRPITRREFAVLANRFLNPFARTVNLSGRLMN
jgi:hypothetical protein